MKKLLAVLAALGISGTAIMSVVACGINPYTNPFDPKPNDPGTSNPTNPDNDKNDGNDGWKNGDNNSDSNREEPTYPPDPTTPTDPDPTPEIKNLYANNDNIKAVFAQATRRTIYQDQYGFDQQYLDQQLFSGRGGLTPEQGSLSSNSSQSDFINYYLNQITGDVNVNGDKGLTSALPFFDFYILPSTIL